MTSAPDLRRGSGPPPPLQPQQLQQRPPQMPAQQSWVPGASPLPLATGAAPPLHQPHSQQPRPASPLRGGLQPSSYRPPPAAAAAPPPAATAAQGGAGGAPPAQSRAEASALRHSTPRVDMSRQLQQQLRRSEAYPPPAQKPPGRERMERDADLP